MFSGSNNVMVLGGTFHDSHVPESPNPNGFERLLQAASPSAFHNSGERFDPPKCHPKTRVNVLEKISNWIDGAEHQKESVMWVNGGAGVGKSAIAQTLAERLAEENRLVASFFFSRADPSRNNANHLVPTIAYHTILHIPHLKDPIIHAVARNPLIFKLSVDAQFSALLIEPIRDLAESGYFHSTTCPRVIIIDGLDECNDPSSQVTILNAVSKALRKANFPLSFLITSRPEHHLSIAFSSKSFNEFLARLTLDDSFFPEHDIRLFLDDQIEELKESHPFRAYLPPSWLNPAHIETLVDKSSGQFIYASTVIKYISASRHRPNHPLDVILGLRPRWNENPFFELDALYSHIFSSLEVEDIARVLDILACRLWPLTVNHWTVAETEAFLSLDAGDIQIALCDLASVVCIEEGPRGSHVKVLHASLSDFLLDQSRSKAFYIEPQLRHAAFAERYLEILTMPDFPPPRSWYFELPWLCQDATLTPRLRTNISSFSLLPVSTNWYDGKDDMNRNDFISFMDHFSFVMERKETAYHHLRKIFDEYLSEYLGNYYHNSSHIFLVALVGIGASFPHHSCQVDPDYQENTDTDINNLFAASDALDEANLSLYRFLDGEGGSPYGRHLHTFLNDSSRSGTCALNGERYAIAALHCLRILCDENSPIQPREYDLREYEILTNWPWIWRKILRPNARALRRYKRKFWKKTTYTIWLRHPNLLEGAGDHCHSRVYRWALRCFRQLLKRSRNSKELLDFASRYCLASRSQDWPRQAKLTRDAINRYIEFCQSEDSPV